MSKQTRGDIAHDTETPIREQAIREIMDAPESEQASLMSYALIDAFSRGRLSGIDEGFAIGRKPADRPSADDAYPHTEIEGAMP